MSCGYVFTNLAHKNQTQLCSGTPKHTAHKTNLNTKQIILSPPPSHTHTHPHTTSISHTLTHSLALYVLASVSRRNEAKDWKENRGHSPYRAHSWRKELAERACVRARVCIESKVERIVPGPFVACCCLFCSHLRTSAKAYGHYWTKLNQNLQSLSN
jgi:hypothetical protein